MKWFLKLIFRGQYHHIQHMRAEIDWLRVQLEHERQRCEVAIDECRMRHQNLGAVSQPPRATTPEQHAQMQSPMGALFPSLAGMGDPAGVPE
jgi:hypothetical protein